MNALLILIILNKIVLQSWRRQTRLVPWFSITEQVLRCLEERQYAWEGAEPDSLAAIFHEQLRAGTLLPGSLRSLLAWIRRLEQDDAERLRLGYSAALRLGLAAGLGLLTSLALDGSWFVHLDRNPPVLLLLLGEPLLLWLWLRRIPAHPLVSCPSMQAKFTRAWLGYSLGGPWHESWTQRFESGRLRGRDVSLEQRQALEDWLLLETRSQEKRQTWAEELFGLVELAGSVYFLGTACALPLLRFGSGATWFN